MNKQTFDCIYETINFITKRIVDDYKRKYSSNNIEMHDKYRNVMMQDIYIATKPYYDYITKCMYKSTEVNLLITKQ